ncbi:MAG TPA: DUF5908 family protein [Burkholderiaceae bacterium]|nr:DUF5908 family protein [Burkholderiaceae bacterium]
MSLEVRQLVLKATVAEDGDESAAGGPAGSGHADKGGMGETTGVDAEQLKQEILAACRQWFQDALRQQRER